MLSVQVLADSWPDSFDVAVLVGYVLIVVGAPVAGFLLLAVDIRAHYRRLRNALVLVSQYTARLPAWVAREAEARRHVPPCVEAFGLTMPFTEEQLLEAYRQKVKTKHPDRGGNREEFLQLQRYFEEARSMLSSDG